MFGKTVSEKRSASITLAKNLKVSTLLEAAEPLTPWSLSTIEGAQKTSGEYMPHKIFSVGIP